MDALFKHPSRTACGGDELLAEGKNSLRRRMSSHARKQLHIIVGIEKDIVILAFILELDTAFINKIMKSS